MKLPTLWLFTSKWMYAKWVSVFGSTQAKITLGVKETVIIRTVQYIYWLFLVSIVQASRYGLKQVICKTSNVKLSTEPTVSIQVAL
jgi:hypothetical protein